MADKGIERAKPTGGLATSAPDFIKRGTEKEGASRLAQFVSPPILKIIQKQTADELLERFGKGTTILHPAGVVVAPANQPFFFTPLIQYPEYLTWAPIEMKGQVPAVLDRSIDPASALARKATNRSTWIEENYVFGEGDERKVIKKVRHVEHITFIVVVHGDFGLQPCVMSFSRAEHKTGRNFASLLQMRNADVFGCVFQATVSSTARTNEQGSWHGWDIENPSADAAFEPWIKDEALYEQFRQLSIGFEEKYQNDLIRPAYDADDSGPAVSARSDM